MKVEREWPHVCVTMRDGEIVGSWRADASPPENIVYVEDGKIWRISVNDATDEQVLRGVEYMSFPR